MRLNSIETRDIRRFGIVAFIFFGSLCALGIWMEKPIPTYLFAFLLLLGIAFILAPSCFRPIYIGWLKITHFIGRIWTILILALCYYAVITPAAFIKRLLGGSPLPIRPDKNALSYWVERREPSQPTERFYKRY
jgi:hypothetical protein